ncbi:CCT_1a_G0031810.mRNA.1.CDS.1 [Saccharomyces cerevisiae]|nr:CCT_1a_G0031810.mRNA.1.CDS.1 [Saccharomyces cerevisiae]CAI7376731.1 CCT_1a_G0031810.mRNA.1.CDS.1 [Saccharomyces cerevisiae]
MIVNNTHILTLPLQSHHHMPYSPSLILIWHTHTDATSIYHSQTYPTLTFHSMTHPH